MIKIQLNRFTGILTAIAVSLIASANIIAADDGPKSFINTPIKALKEKNPKALWNMMPATYQNDLNQLLQTFANEMDQELWDAAFGLISNTGELLKTQNTLIMKSLPQLGEGLSAMSGGENPMDIITQSLSAEDLKITGTFMEKFAKSDFGSIAKLKKIDLGNVIETYGKDFMASIEEAAQASGEENPFDLEVLQSIKVEVVSEDASEATIRVSGLPETPDLGTMAELPGGIPIDLGDMEDLPLPNLSELENGEVILTKVEGKWIPKDMANGWKEGIAMAKQGMGGLSDLIPIEDKRMALGMIKAVNSGLNRVKKAKTAEQFNMATMQAIMQVTMASAQIEAGGGDVSQAQKKEARKLAEGEIGLTNGDILKGVVSDVDGDGIVVSVDVGGFSKRVNWMQLDQESLKKIRKLGQTDNKRYGVKTARGWIGADYFVEPFIVPEVSALEQSDYPKAVGNLSTPNLPNKPELDVTSKWPKLAAYSSPGGIGLLVVIAIGSLAAGMGVAAFKESNVVLAAGISFVLPILGPLLLLAKPKVEYEYEESEEDDDYYQEEAEAPAGATMSDTGGSAVAGMLPEAKKMSFAQSGPKKQTNTEAQSWSRDDTRFDRSFFQNNFPNYFKSVLGPSERGMVLAIKTGKREYVGQRMKRISGSDLHMELLNGKEQKIAFSEVGSVNLRPK